MKYLAIVAVEERAIPGLAAMEPGGEFVTMLNRNNDGQPTPRELAYYAITSDFEYRSSTTRKSGLSERFLLRLADGAVDQLMQQRPNDLVVHTASMSEVDPGTPNLLREISALGSNLQVHHLIYFAQPQVCRDLANWLSLDIKASVFDTNRGRGKRGRGADAFTFEPLDPVRYKPAAPPKHLTGIRSGSLTSRPFASDQVPVEVQVVWDDLRNVEADVYAVGHYRGIRPQRAEWALDQFVSTQGDGSRLVQNDRLILTQLTDRGHLVGELGDIDLYPISRAAYAKPGRRKAPGRLAAICGMGYPGTFDEYGLRLLTSNLISVLNLFPDLQSLCTVLIGSGDGGLSIEASVQSAMRGYTDALRAGTSSSRVKTIKIVELYRHRAELIYEALDTFAREHRHAVTLADSITTKGDGLYHESHRRSFALAHMAFASQRGDKADAQALSHLLTSLPKTLSESDVTASLEELITPDTKEIAQLARRLEIHTRSDEPRDDTIPTRISFVRSDAVLKSAAITDSTTVPERVIDVEPSLITEAARRMTAPRIDEVKALSKLMFSLVIPRDFRSLMRGSSPIVFEVDRHMAAVHWEMLMSALDDEDHTAIGLSRPVSRQLRTTYSAPPTPAPVPGAPLKALVIGDPTDDLPSAREEAREVAAYLNRSGVNAVSLIGSEKASRFDTLRRLILDGYHLVHFAGHGTYDAVDPSKTGWVFKGGVLRAAEIRRMDTPPLVVFANACLSSKNSQRRYSSQPAEAAPPAGTAGGDPLQAPSEPTLSKAEKAFELERRPYGDAGLLPSLADEFFKCGVRNYIGAAWEVNDEGARAFALSFYEDVLDGKKSIGEALLEARLRLAKRKRLGCLWGAYQHYGDPGFTLR